MRLGFRLAALSTALAGLALAPGASGFPHIVQKGETLADIAERIYGRVELEQVLVSANRLDAAPGVVVRPGMRLEIPSIEHHRATAGETWKQLAELYLGDPERGEVLARANDRAPWIEPKEGEVIAVPYNLLYVARRGDSTLTVAYRFLGERDQAWMLDRYNDLDGRPISPGDALLVPIVELPLTDVGRIEAERAARAVRSQSQGQSLDAQRAADAILIDASRKLSVGDYLGVVADGNRALGFGDLSLEQTAELHRALTEAYVALGARGSAEDACLAWRTADPSSPMDPVWISPKVLDACRPVLPKTPEPYRDLPQNPGGPGPEEDPDYEPDDEDDGGEEEPR